MFTNQYGMVLYANKTIKYTKSKNKKKVLKRKQLGNNSYWDFPCCI